MTPDQIVTYGTAIATFLGVITAAAWKLSASVKPLVKLAGELREALGIDDSEEYETLASKVDALRTETGARFDAHEVRIKAIEVRHEQLGCSYSAEVVAEAEAPVS